MAHISKIKLANNTYDLKDTISPRVHYLEAESTSSNGVWKASDDTITEYYSGLMVFINTKSYAGSSSTTLNINNLGAKKVYYNTTTAMNSTYAPANTVQALVYDTSLNSNAGGWKSVYSYNSNTDTNVTQSLDTTSDSTIWNRLLFTFNSSSSRASSITSGTTKTVKYTENIAVQPYTGTIAANLFDGGLSYLTSAPTSANTTGGVKLVVLNSEPATKYNGYLYIIKEGGAAADDLTGTTWLFNSQLTPIGGSSVVSYQVNFSCTSTYVPGPYTYIHILGGYGGSYDRIEYSTSSSPGSGGTTVYGYGSDAWYESGTGTRTITITGGTDATNSSLIAWLQANAVQQ